MLLILSALTVVVTCRHRFLSPLDNANEECLQWMIYGI
jgi:hypothetical protein